MFYFCILCKKNLYSNLNSNIDASSSNCYPSLKIHRKVQYFMFEFSIYLTVQQLDSDAFVLVTRKLLSLEKVTVVVQLQVLNFPLTTFPALFSSGFGFLAYETFKEAILGMNGALTKVNKETGDTVLTPFGGLVCGALAGASSQTVA